MQGFRKHQVVDPLTEPGHTDLTANVDFSYLAESMSEFGASLLSSLWRWREPVADSRSRLLPLPPRQPRRTARSPSRASSPRSASSPVSPASCAAPRPTSAARRSRAPPSASSTRAAWARSTRSWPSRQRAPRTSFRSTLSSRGLSRRRTSAATTRSRSTRPLGPAKGLPRERASFSSRSGSKHSVRLPLALDRRTTSARKELPAFRDLPLLLLGPPRPTAPLLDELQIYTPTTTTTTMTNARDA